MANLDQAIRDLTEAVNRQRLATEAAGGSSRGRARTGSAAKGVLGLAGMVPQFRAMTAAIGMVGDGAKKFLDWARPAMDLNDRMLSLNTKLSTQLETTVKRFPSEVATYFEPLLIATQEGFDDVGEKYLEFAYRNERTLGKQGKMVNASMLQMSGKLGYNAEQMDMLSESLYVTSKIRGIQTSKLIDALKTVSSSMTRARGLGLKTEVIQSAIGELVGKFGARYQDSITQVIDRAMRFDIADTARFGALGGKDLIKALQGNDMSAMVAAFDKAVSNFGVQIDRTTTGNAAITARLLETRFGNIDFVAAVRNLADAQKTRPDRAVKDPFSEDLSFRRTLSTALHKYEMNMALFSKGVAAAIIDPIGGMLADAQSWMEIQNATMAKDFADDGTDAHANAVLQLQQAQDGNYTARMAGRTASNTKAIHQQLVANSAPVLSERFSELTNMVNVMISANQTFGRVVDHRALDQGAFQQDMIQALRDLIGTSQQTAANTTKRTTAPRRGNKP